MRIGVITFIVFSLFGCTQAMHTDICMTVCDIDNKLPIADVYAFISNSEYGSASQKDGSCRFDFPDYVNQVLVLYHKDFSVKHIPYRLYHTYQNCDTVYMQKIKSNQPSSSTAERPKKRQKHYKKFKKYFIGNDKSASKCHIVNPEVLRFSDNKDVFLASAKDLLHIRNEYLGYDIKFLLTEFRIEADGSSRFQGKAKFTDTSNASNKSAITSSRKQTFRRSPKFFYQALIYDNLDKNGFEIKLEKLENNAFTLLSQPRASDLVEFKPKSESFYLRFIEFLTIIDKNNKIRNELSKTFGLSLAANNRINNASREDRVKLSSARSYLYKTSAFLEIDMYGNLLNPGNLQEYGFWATQRLADQLPYYYGNENAEKARQDFQQSQVNQIRKHTTHNSASQPKDTIINGFILSDLLIPIRDIKYGGVQKDDIPAIDNPTFTKIENIDYLSDNDLLLIVNKENYIKAFPLKILTRHEIVNDQHIIITYCPLCHSGIVFDISQMENKSSFGVSGLLYQSDVLMYDRKTNSLWSQIESKAIAGPLSGTTLDIIPSSYMSWKDLKINYPDARILDAPGNIKSRYDQPLYTQYRKSDRLMFPVNHRNATLPNKTEVLGITLENKSVAIPIEKIMEAKDGVKYIIANSILTARFDNGEFKVYDSEENPIPFQHMYWFAWYTFNPETEIFRK